MRKAKSERLIYELQDGRTLPLVLKKAKRKSLKLSLDARGRAEVTIPLSGSRKEALRLLRSKENWLLKQLRQYEHAVHLPLFSPEEEQIRRRLLKAEAEAFFREKTPASWPRKPERIQIRAQKTRWDSCSGRNTISLNVYLTALPEELRHYVFYHEMCHLKHPNHQKAFWQTLESFCPDCRALRRELARYRLPF